VSPEIELKLAIAADQIPRLSRLPFLRSSVQPHPRPARLFSVYYDTPDFELRNQGVALRLRRVGRQWVQTLKSAGRVEAGLHQREELETALPAQIVNFPALTQSGLAPVLSDPALPVRLKPVFATVFQRQTRGIEIAPDSQIELCIDRGSINAGNLETPISEVELELKAGPPERIVELALRILEEVPLRLEPESKAERGYALATGATTAPVKATSPALASDMTVDEAFRAVVFGCIAHLQANERGVIESDDPEFLHQARVALRRLRSSLTVFKSAFPTTAFSDMLPELRWLGMQLGPARDWDVFSTETLSQVSSAFPGDPGLHQLTEQTAGLRAAAGTAARESVASTRYTRLLLQIIDVFLRRPWMSVPDPESATERERPLLDFAAAVLARRHQSVVKKGHDLSTLDAEGLHRLRIQAKKLRYAAEFFSALYDRKQVRDYVAAMARIQESLGALNDAVTAERLLETLRDDDPSALTLEAIGLLRGWAVSGHRGQLERLPRDWERFRDTEVFWE
jgi:inorganic triphosphatase YgiF